MFYSNPVYKFLSMILSVTYHWYSYEAVIDSNRHDYLAGVFCLACIAMYRRYRLLVEFILLSVDEVCIEVDLKLTALSRTGLFHIVAGT